ncbi:MAG TPA: hypothetical protein VKC17_12375, partial [Sphingomicrobium sp.]|nr:hypothetical protein [Sphingomicrobium sp.]
AAVFAMLFGDIKVFTPAFVVVAGVAVFLGLPIYLAARAARNDTPIVAAVMGFIVGGAIPAILIFAGPRADQASVGDTATIINGSYTLAGWLQSLGLVGLFGLLGVGSALVFWLIVRRSASGGTANAESAPSRPFRTTLLPVAAAGVIAAAFAIPYVTADRSCHNPLRGGGTSIGEVASFDLGVGVDQWRNVEKEVDDFRRSGDWSVRSDVRTDESFPWLQISLCKEPGTNILVQGFADLNVVSFSVYQPQGGLTWRRDFGVLYERISARWPTKIAFRDKHGSPTAAPEWTTNKERR